MSIAEQALFLLDIPPSVEQRNKLENFSDLEPVVRASIKAASGETEAAPARTEAAAPYSMASRMSRPNYEDQARAEALTSALQKLRANYIHRPSNGTRVIRES
jgi:hypothetical protein